MCFGTKMNQYFIKLLCASAAVCLQPPDGQLHLIMNRMEVNGERSHFNLWKVNEIKYWIQIKQIPIDLETLNKEYFPGYQPMTEWGMKGSWTPQPLLCIMKPDFKKWDNDDDMRHWHDGVWNDTITSGMMKCRHNEERKEKRKRKRRRRKKKQQRSDNQQTQKSMNQTRKNRHLKFQVLLLTKGPINGLQLTDSQKLNLKKLIKSQMACYRAMKGQRHNKGTYQYEQRTLLSTLTETRLSSLQLRRNSGVKRYSEC